MRGKLRVGLAPKPKNWQDVTMAQFALWTLKRPVEAALTMTPSQRAAVQAEADAFRLSEFNKRKTERDRVHAEWRRSEHPALTWAGHCTAIRREDLIRNECISRLGVFDSDYQGT